MQRNPPVVLGGQLPVGTPWQLRAGLGALFAGVLLVAFQDAADPADEETRLGEGEHRYAWVHGWGGAALAPGALGNTHGCVASDSQGRIYVNTDSARAIVRVSADGSSVEAWGEELAGGLHGMAIVQEEAGEFLWFAHTARHEAGKATLEGEILWTVGVPPADDLYARPEEYLPTSIAVAPDGRFFVADGYGKSYVHRYGADRAYLGSFGGVGDAPGKMRTPHGLWIDRRGGVPRLVVADRENGRLQVFDLDGNPLRVIEADLRRPCNVHGRGDELVVAELGGRVTVLGRDDRVVARLGDQPDESLRAVNGVPSARWVDGAFLAPHGAHWDARGDLYVVEWLAEGRVSKLRRLP